MDAWFNVSQKDPIPHTTSEKMLYTVLIRVSLNHGYDSPDAIEIRNVLSTMVCERLAREESK